MRESGRQFDRTYKSQNQIIIIFPSLSYEVLEGRELADWLTYTYLLTVRRRTHTSRQGRLLLRRNSSKEAKSRGWSKIIIIDNPMMWFCWFLHTDLRITWDRSSLNQGGRTIWRSTARVSWTNKEEFAILVDLFHQSITKCNSWRYFLSLIELIRKKGLEKVTIDELVNELVDRGTTSKLSLTTWYLTLLLFHLHTGRNTVPNKIKEDLLARIKNYFEDEGYWLKSTNRQHNL